MKFRFDRFSTIGGALVLAALVAVAPASAQDPPVIDVDTLPEGVPPRQTQATGRAEIALSQAENKVQEDGPGAGDADFQTGLQHALEELTADPGNPLGMYQAGRAYLGLGDFVAADSMFTKAVDLHPRYVVDVNLYRENAWIDAYNAGLQALDADNRSEAIAQWERAGVIFDKRPEAHLNLASVMGGDDAEATIDHYQQALSILTNPDNRMYQDSATLASWDSNEPIARLNLAVLFLQDDRYTDARPQLEAMVAKDPENTDALSMLSVVLQSLGMTDSAAVISEKLMGTEAMGPMEMAAMGSTFFQAGDFEQAAAAFARVLGIVPDHRDAAFNYALALQRAEDWEALEQAAIRLRELDPAGLGWISFGLRAYAQTGRDTEPMTTAASQLQFEVDKLTFSPQAEGATVGGVVIGNTVEPGTEVELRFYFYGETGEELGTENVSVRTGAVGDMAADPPVAPEEVMFGVVFESDDPVVGYRYEVVG